MTLTPSEIVLIFLISKPIFIFGTIVLVALGAREPEPGSIKQLTHEGPKQLESAGTMQD